MVERVRVTGPPRHPAARRPGVDRTRELRDQPDGTGAVGQLYLRSLLREQLGLAARVIALLAVTLGSVPLVFHLAPQLGEREVLGLPVAWVLLGGVVHPFLLLLGWRFVRRAERNEQVFAALVRGDTGDGAAGDAVDGGTP